MYFAGESRLKSGHKDSYLAYFYETYMWIPHSDERLALVASNGREAGKKAAQKAGKGKENGGR